MLNTECDELIPVHESLIGILSENSARLDVDDSLQFTETANDLQSLVNLLLVFSNQNFGTRVTQDVQHFSRWVRWIQTN